MDKATATRIFKEKKKKKSILIRLEPELGMALENFAKDSGVSMAEVIRVILRELFVELK